ncbi:hypothetical protein S83_020265, partial [Arachis hypogaea]
FDVLKLFVYFRDRSSGQLSLDDRMNSRIRREALERIVGEGDRNCIWELRMNTNAFANLCEFLKVQEGLKEDGHLSLLESGEIVSKYFNKILKVGIRIQSILFAKATPVEEDCLDLTWRRFRAYSMLCDFFYLKNSISEYHNFLWMIGLLGRIRWHLYI